MNARIELLVNDAGRLAAPVARVKQPSEPASKPACCLLNSRTIGEIHDSQGLVRCRLVVSTSAAAAPGRQFLDNAIRGDNSEATLGRLIAAHGYSAQVRSFGRTLTRDHKHARVQASAVRRSIGMRPPTSMMAEARSEYHRLEHLRGRAFDREVRRYMIHDHRNDIADFEAQARSGDRRTARLAREQLSTLRKHLRLAMAIRA